MVDTPVQHECRSVPLPSGGQPGAVLSDYGVLAEAWVRQGWLLRAIALCRVILRLEPGHGPTRRLLAELDGRRHEPQALEETAPLSAEPEPARDSFLARLGEEALLSVMGELELRVFHRGELILEEGQPGSSMFLIVEGSVEVVRTLKSGRHRTVAFLDEGDFFGEMALLSDMPRLASVRAFERTAVLELTRERLERIIQQHPSVGEVLRAFHRERLLDNVLRGNRLFRALSASQREALALDFEPCSRPAGARLLEQGQAVDTLYLLLRGRCQVLHRHPDGSESLLQSLEEGDMFGEISLLLGLPATASVRAETPCLLLRLDRESCARHLLDQPGVREALTQLGAERLQRTAGLASELEPPDYDPCI